MKEYLVRERIYSSVHKSKIIPIITTILRLYSLYKFKQIAKKLGLFFRATQLATSH